MKSNILSLNMSNEIKETVLLPTHPNSSLLCQLFIENENANKDELQELSQRYNMPFELVSSF